MKGKYYILYLYLKIFPFYFKHLFLIEKWQQQMMMNFKMFLQVKIPQMMVSFSKYYTKNYAFVIVPIFESISLLFLFLYKKAVTLLVQTVLSFQRKQGKTDVKKEWLYL